mmetsp:Transcript_44035/g.71685  ORF Transcript_44035/g.71685 Transcript_44035/m.71685 type:complete len:914 (-) Transcript_44035:196-2937(-)|eukprot:CAMPEP_0184671004 /NCGR_PEP_ID=MMETSP0308-20130426/84903_1 /TAXON_ID=38269 /ORGANISM="Gloeochaete witrockiana, Strain SAG 46.84" /LENGTH=913 /DNA_ID=CAMNT_0027117993 /DNA_START=113 /DNA_END=2854 /DNA_ORIENTATION=-
MAATAAATAIRNTQLDNGNEVFDDYFSRSFHPSHNVKHSAAVPRKTDQPLSARNRPKSFDESPKPHRRSLDEPRHRKDRSRQKNSDLPESPTTEVIKDLNDRDSVEHSNIPPQTLQSNLSNIILGKSKVVPLNGGSGGGEYKGSTAREPIENAKSELKMASSTEIGRSGSVSVPGVPPVLKLTESKLALLRTDSLSESQLNILLKYSGDRQLLFAILGIVIMVLQKEILYSMGRCSIYVDSLKIAISLSTLALLYMVIKYYMIRVRILRRKFIIPKNTTILYSGILTKFLAEVIICAVHPAPYVDRLDPKVENYLCVFMFLRLIYYLRYLIQHSPLFTPSGRFIGVLTNVEFGPAFVFKTMLSERPWTFIVVAYMLLLSITSFSMIQFERLEVQSSGDDGHDLLYYRNVLWLLIITSLTVGYGDVFPRTDQGRCIAVMTAVVGACITALGVALLHTQLELTLQQGKVVQFLQKDAARKAIKSAAVSAVQSCWRYSVAKKRVKRFGRLCWQVEMRHAEQRMYANVAVWRNLRRSLQTSRSDSAYKHQVTVVESIFSAVKDLTDRLEENGILEAPEAVCEAETEESVLSSPRSGTSRRNSTSSVVNTLKSAAAACSLSSIKNLSPRASAKSSASVSPVASQKSLSNPVHPGPGPGRRASTAELLALPAPLFAPATGSLAGGAAPSQAGTIRGQMTRLEDKVNMLTDRVDQLYALLELSMGLNSDKGKRRNSVLVAMTSRNTTFGKASSFGQGSTPAHPHAAITMATSASTGSRNKNEKPEVKLSSPTYRSASVSAWPGSPPSPVVPVSPTTSNGPSSSMTVQPPTHPSPPPASPAASERNGSTKRVDIRAPPAPPDKLTLDLSEPEDPCLTSSDSDLPRPPEKVQLSIVRTPSRKGLRQHLSLSHDDDLYDTGIT